MKTLKERFDKRYNKFKKKLEKYMAKHCTENYPRVINTPVYDCDLGYDPNAKLFGYYLDVDTESYAILYSLFQRYMMEEGNIGITTQEATIINKRTGEQYVLLKQLTMHRKEDMPKLNKDDNKRMADA